MTRHDTGGGDGGGTGAGPAPGAAKRCTLGDILSGRAGGGLPLSKRLLWPAIRAYAHLELPRFGHLLHWWGMNEQHKWAGAAYVRTRDKHNGHALELDLSDFFQRIAYFFGCYNEEDVLSACDAAIGEGDAFVDGGANIGLVTLHAAARVGPRGRVDAFECNPRIVPRLRSHVSANGLSNVTIHELGLGDAPAELPMRLPGAGNDAAGTFSPIPERYGGQQTELGMVRIVRGDDVLDPDDTRPLTMKLDVEGFEIKAMQGMERTLERRRPALITEINPELLERCGGSVDSMRDLLAPMGYKPFAIDRGGFRSRHRLWLHPLVGPELGWERDLMWIAEGSVHWQRLAKAMQPRGNYWRHLQFAREAAEARQRAAAAAG